MIGGMHSWNTPKTYTECSDPSFPEPHSECGYFLAGLLQDVCVSLSYSQHLDCKGQSCSTGIQYFEKVQIKTRCFKPLIQQGVLKQAERGISQSNIFQAQTQRDIYKEFLVPQSIRRLRQPLKWIFCSKFRSEEKLSSAEMVFYQQLRKQGNIGGLWLWVSPRQPF